MAKSQTSKLSNKELQDKVDSLEQEIASLKKQSSKSGKFSRSFKTFAVWFLVLICALSLNLTVAAGWLKRNVINTDIWTSKTSAIMRDSEFQKELSTKITDEIFEATNAETVIQDFIPPRASALKGPLTQSLKSYTNEQVAKILASEQFQTYWTDLNKSAHAGILASIENSGQKPENSNYVVYIDNDKLLLNLDPIVKRIRSDLGNAGLNFPDKLTGDRISKTITLTEIDSMPTVLYAFDTLNKVAPLLFFLAAISGGAAIAISKNKRKTIIALSMSIIILMILNVQAIYFARAPLVQQASDALQSSSSTAASNVFDILTKDLITYSRALVLISIIVLLVAVMTGPGKFAKYTRDKVAGLTSDKNNKLINNLENNASTYVALLGIIYVILVILGITKNLTAALLILVVFSLLSFWLISIKKS